MCTKTIQNETRKRREIQDALRPLAAAVLSGKDDPLEIAQEARLLISDLGIRSCCITFPGEAHGSQGKGCFLR